MRDKGEFGRPLGLGVAEKGTLFAPVRRVTGPAGWIDMPHRSARRHDASRHVTGIDANPRAGGGKRSVSRGFSYYVLVSLPPSLQSQHLGMADEIRVDQPTVGLPG